MNKSLIGIAFALSLSAFTARAESPAVDLAQVLPGHYTGNSFGESGTCSIDIVPTTKGLFARPALNVTIHGAEGTMSFVALVDNLNTSLAQGHFGQGVAIDEIDSGVLNRTSNYVLFQMDEGRLYDARIDLTKANVVGFVESSQDVTCGNVTKEE